MSRFVASEPCCVGGAHRPSADCQYQVAWSINPHMQIGAVDVARAIAQHAALLRTVRAAGGHVDTVPFVHGAFDSVFAKDNGLYTNKRGHTHALLAMPRHSVRQIEQHARARDFRRAGIEVHPTAAEFEGGDVVVPSHGRYALLGHGFRSATTAVKALEEFLELPVAALELVDPALYHLDTALAALADGTIVYCEDAFSADGRRALAALPGSTLVPVSRDEAMRFALNFVEIGDTIVTGTDSAEVCARLEACGKRVLYTPLDQFQLAGGSAACLLGQIHDVRAVASAQRSTAA